MKKMAYLLISLFLFANLFMGCSSTGGTQTSTASQSQQKKPQTSAVAQSQQKAETELELEKYQRIFIEDSQKLVVGGDGRTTMESIEAAFHPKAITSMKEISKTVLPEPGRPYYFKIRAIYKGFDKTNEKVYLQDIGENQANVKNAVSGIIWGVNTDIYVVDIIGGDAVAATFPTETNSIADFYFVTLRVTEYPDDIIILTRFVRNIVKSGFDPKKFIVANGVRYITVNDFKAPTQKDIQNMMLNMMSGGLGPFGNSQTDIFDPITYPLADLMDARVAMDKKDLRNDYTLPKVRVKYVSEVVFKGQTNTTIRVSTSDNVLTERMNFAGRASTIRDGEKIRVYYTIAKDPLEIWEVHAIERL